MTVLGHDCLSNSGVFHTNSSILKHSHDTNSVTVRQQIETDKFERCNGKRPKKLGVICQEDFSKIYHQCSSLNQRCGLMVKTL